MRPNRQETADLVTFTEEILNGKLHFLCSVSSASLSGAEFFQFVLCLEPEQREQEAYPQQKMLRNGMYLQSVKLV